MVAVAAEVLSPKSKGEYFQMEKGNKMCLEVNNNGSIRTTRGNYDISIEKGWSIKEAKLAT